METYVNRNGYAFSSNTVPCVFFFFTCVCVISKPPVFDNMSAR